MTEHNEEIPLFATAIDMIEAVEAMKNIAHLVVTLKTELIAGGFSDAEALALCGTWLTAAAQQGRSGQ